MKVLVAYASRHGATEGIAQRIAQTLERRGLEVTLQPAERADGVEQYDAFVIGSAAYAFHWLKDAAQFVRRHHALLAGRPVWLFSSGPLGTERVDAKGRDQLEVTIPREFGEFDEQIQPRGKQVFFGAYDPDAPPDGIAERFMKGFMRVTPALRGALPIGDFRDWPAIEAWADEIAQELRKELAPAAVAHA
jgi:menaquinone-dependent protoporphyrinogen oxidase